MTAQEFHDLASETPEVLVAVHLAAEAVTFRGRTIGRIGSPNPEIVTLRLSLDDQRGFLARDLPGLTKEPGARGTLRIRLEATQPEIIHELLLAACRHVVAAAAGGA